MIEVICPHCGKRINFDEEYDEMICCFCKNRVTLSERLRRIAMKRKDADWVDEFEEFSAMFED